MQNPPHTHLNIVQGLREVADNHDFVGRPPVGLLEDGLQKAAKAAHLSRVVPEGGWRRQAAEQRIHIAGRFFQTSYDVSCLSAQVKEDKKNEEHQRDNKKQGAYGSIFSRHTIFVCHAS